MSTLWQTVLATILVLTLSYLLLSLAPSILSLMTGEIWADSPMLGALFVKLQTKKYDKLKAMWEPETASGPGATGTLSEFQERVLQPDPRNVRPRTSKEAQKHRRLFEFYTRFPRDPAYIAPTTLGNALNATAIDLWQRYRIDMAALWPYMETLLADKSLAARVEHEKASLDFLLNLAFVLNLFAVEYFLVHLWTTQQVATAVGWAGFFVVLAYVVYRAGVGKARAWGDLVQMAFDLHRDTLREKLGLAPFKSRAVERAAWDQASRWFLWGPSPEMLRGAAEWPDAIFKDEPPAPASPSFAPTSVASANLQVHIESAFVKQDKLEGPVEHSGRVTWYKKLEYCVILNSAAAPDAGVVSSLDSAFMIITDPRVLFIHQKSVEPLKERWVAVPEWAIIDVEGQDYKHKLLWQFPRLPAPGVRVFRYQLRVPVIDITTNFPKLSIKPTLEPDPARDGLAEPRRYKLEITNDSGHDVSGVMVEVIDTRLPQATEPPTADLTGSSDPDAPPDILATIGDRPRRYCWKIGAIKATETVTLFFEV